MEQILISDELKLLRRTIKSFIKNHVIPEEEKEGIEVQKLPQEVVCTLQEKAKKSGLWFLGAKIEWGGAGLGFFEQAVLLEEAVQHRLGFYQPAAHAFGKSLPGFLEKCSKEQIEKYVIPSINSGNGCFVALWEEAESNDLNHLQCSAVQNGDFWTINGKKSYVLDAETADFGIILVNCLTESGEKKPTLFIIEKFDLVRKKGFVLLDVLPGYELEFADFRIPDNRRIGEIGEGIPLIVQWLTESQVLLAARCIGIAKKALELSTNYASLRITRNKTLSDYPLIRSMLANSAAEIEAARLLVWDAALKLDRKAKDSFQRANMAKWIATEVASKTVDRSIQIHGGMGFTRDVPLERWYKELRISRLEHLSSETLHENIADALLQNVKHSMKAKEAAV